MTVARTSSPINKNQRVAYLDGIRALAALHVLISHSFLESYANSTVPIPYSGWTLWLNLSHLAVDTFIVLSGFCLGLPIARQQKLAGGALQFFRRRARRILPPFYAAWLLTIVLKLGSPHVRTHFIHPNLPYVKMFLFNTFLLQDFFPGFNWMNTPFWSVAVEWKIYYLFPLVVLIGLRWGWKAALATTAAVSLLVTYLLHLCIPSLLMDHTCPWYIFLFGMGVWAVQFTTNEDDAPRISRNFAVTAIVGVIISAIIIRLHPIAQVVPIAEYAPYLPVIDLPFGLAVACSLGALATTSDRALLAVRRVLSSKPLVFIGSFSYSIYLVHNPILDTFISIVFRHSLGRYTANYPPELKFLIILLVGVPLIVFASYRFFLVAERPYLTSRSSVPKN